MKPRKLRLASAAISRVQPAGFSTRILIVDQDRQVGVSLSFMLSARSYDEVRAVRSAGRALTITEQFRPEIVFLDLELPDDGTMAVARTLARDSRRPRPRLFALASGPDATIRDNLR